MYITLMIYTFLHIHNLHLAYIALKVYQIEGSG